MKFSELTVLITAVLLLSSQPLYAQKPCPALTTSFEVTLRRGTTSRLLLSGTMTYSESIARFDFSLSPVFAPPEGNSVEEESAGKEEEGGEDGSKSSSSRWDQHYQFASFRRPSKPAKEEGDDNQTSEKEPSGSRSQPITLVVDRPRNRLLVIFPSTRSWQELPLDRLDPLRDPLLLGVVAMGDEWIERWWKAVQQELSKPVEEAAEDLAQMPRLAFTRLGRRAIGERIVEGYRIEVGERGEIVFFLDKETMLPLSIKARSAATLLQLSTQGLSPLELDCAQLTRIPADYEKLPARKGTDLLILGLFQRLGLGLRTKPVR